MRHHTGVVKLCSKCAHAHASPCWRVPPLHLHQAAGVRALPNQVDSHFGKSSLRTCDLWFGSDACPPLPLNVEKRGTPRVVKDEPRLLVTPVSDRLGAPADRLWPQNGHGSNPSPPCGQQVGGGIGEIGSSRRGATRADRR